MAASIEIRKILDGVLEKIDQPRRRQIDYAKLLRKNHEAMAKAQREFMQWLGGHARKRVGKLRMGTATKMAASLTDDKEVLEKGQEFFIRPMAESFADGYEMLPKMEIKKDWTKNPVPFIDRIPGEHYDVHFPGPQIDPVLVHSVNYAKFYSAELIQAVHETFKGAVRRVIQDAIDQKWGLWRIKKELNRVLYPGKDMGNYLNDRQTNFHHRTRIEMAQAGYSQDQIEKWSTAYIKKAWKYRLEMIARTETARSATQGMLRAYSYMGIQAVKWIADPECCDACDEKNGKVYSVSQMREVPMEAPPLHPNCECVLVYTAAELPKSERGRTNIQIADDLKEKLGLERVEFRGILPDVSEEISELLQKLYKQMESYLEEVEVGSANANAYASTASSGDRITFAEGWYNNLDEMLDKLIENMRTKWHPRMKEKHLLPSVTLHEFVHSSGATQYWKLRNKKTEFWNELVEIMRPYYDLEDEWKEQVEMGMMTHEQFEKRLREIYPSGYAFESTDELIAEAVTDAVYGTETKEMSKKIYDLWIKHFSRKGGE